MNPFISFLSGIFAAFTPCVIILIPVVLYRFSSEKKLRVRPYALFVLGFLFAYLALGELVSSLFTSSVQNGIKLGFGLLFITLGVLSLLDKINPVQFPLFKSPLLFGASFAFIIAFNPCTIPYLSVVIALSKTASLVHIAAFGLGLLVPSLAFALIGKSVLDFAHRNAHLFKRTNQVMSVVLIVSGAYLALTIKSFGAYDIYLSSFFLIIVYALILKYFIIVSSRRELYRPRNIVLLFALFLILASAIVHCHSFVQHHEGDSGELTCSAQTLDCVVCTRCITTFGLALLLGVGSIFFSSALPRFFLHRGRRRGRGRRKLQRARKE